MQALEILQYEFMRKAFLAGIMVAMLCPTMGIFLVLRRLSMVGDTLAHVSLSGIMLGILLHTNPIPIALMLSVVFSLFLEKLRVFFRYYGELSLAIIMSAGLGTAVILIGITRSSDASISSLLFGSIITLSGQDLLLTAVISCAVFILILLFYRELLFITYDEEGALLSGLNVRFFNHLLIILTAVVVALGLRIVGALLISSLMVIPVASALLLGRGFLKTLLWSNLFSLLAVLAGLTASYYLDLAPGGTIVVFSVLNLLVLLPLTLKSPRA